MNFILTFCCWEEVPSMRVLLLGGGSSGGRPAVGIRFLRFARNIGDPMDTDVPGAAKEPPAHSTNLTKTASCCWAEVPRRGGVLQPG